MKKILKAICNNFFKTEDGDASVALAIILLTPFLLLLIFANMDSVYLENAKKEAQRQLDIATLAVANSANNAYDNCVITTDHIVQGLDIVSHSNSSYNYQRLTEVGDVNVSNSANNDSGLVTFKVQYAAKRLFSNSILAGSNKKSSIFTIESSALCRRKCTGIFEEVLACQVYNRYKNDLEEIEDSSPNLSPDHVDYEAFVKNTYNKFSWVNGTVHFFTESAESAGTNETILNSWSHPTTGVQDGYTIDQVVTEQYEKEDCIEWAQRQATKVSNEISELFLDLSNLEKPGSYTDPSGRGALSGPYSEELQHQNDRRINVTKVSYITLDGGTKQEYNKDFLDTAVYSLRGCNTYYNVTQQSQITATPTSVVINGKTYNVSRSTYTNTASLVGTGVISLPDENNADLSVTRPVIQQDGKGNLENSSLKYSFYNPIRNLDSRSTCHTYGNETSWTTGGIDESYGWSGNDSSYSRTKAEGRTWTETHSSTTTGCTTEIDWSGKSKDYWGCGSSSVPTGWCRLSAGNCNISSNQCGLEGGIPCVYAYKSGTVTTTWTSTEKETKYTKKTCTSWNYNYSDYHQYCKNFNYELTKQYYSCANYRYTKATRMYACKQYVYKTSNGMC